MSTEITVQKTDFKTLIATLGNPKASSTERGKALSSMVDFYSTDLNAILPKHIDFNRMKQLFILSVKNIPKLIDCDPGSLIKALFTASAMGLEPDPYFGQIYLIPYGKTVQVIPGYKGLLQLVRNSGEISSIVAEAVCKNDEFDYDLASGQRPKHKPCLDGDRGPAVAYYCIANFRDGGFHFELMTKGQVDDIKGRSAASKTGKSPWSTDYDEMAKKTVIRRAVKRLPISLTRQARVAIMAEDAFNSGKTIDIDHQTGEAIDIWAEPVEEAPALTTVKTSRLESFAAAKDEDLSPPVDIDLETGEVSQTGLHLSN